MTGLLPLGSRSVALFALFTLLLSAGCKQDSNPFSAPQDNPEKAMIAQAVVVEGTLIVALEGVRNQLNAAQALLRGIDSASADAYEVISDLVNHSGPNLRASGVAGNTGIVANAFPSGFEGLIGEDWADRPEIADALNVVSLQIGGMFTILDVPSVLYTRTIGTTVPAEGVVFAVLDLDSLFVSSIEFAGIDTVQDREFFALDDTGLILYDPRGIYTGLLFSDPERFSPDQAAVTAEMVDPGQENGSATLDLSDAPGGEGERYLGWVHAHLVNDRFWVMAVSLPVEGS